MSAMQVFEAPLGEVLVDEDFNCRGHIAPIDVAGLAKDIEENGLIQPITLMLIDEERAKSYPDKKYLLIAGHRRFMAFRINKSATIPALLRGGAFDEKTARVANLVENLQREDLTIMQEALALKKVMDLGLTEPQAMKRLGKARGWVQVRNMILKLPVPVQDEVEAGWLNQLQIRDIYTHFLDRGELACFETVKEFKKDRTRGRMNTRRKLSTKKKKYDPNEKKKRDRDAIFAMQEKVYTQLRNNVVTKTLAWCAGEISNEDFHFSVEQFADQIGENYRCP